MESKTNYTLVGLFVLVLGSATIFTSLWLSVGLHNKVYHTYAVYMNEAVSGLSEQSVVKFNGVVVGYVKEVALNHEDPQQVRILAEIEAGTPVTTSTTATLMSQGITGLTYIGLKAGTKSNHPLKKEAGEPYPIIPSRPSLLLQLDRAAKDISENFKDVADSVQNILDKDNAIALKNSLRNIEELTETFAKQSKTMQDILIKTNHFLENASRGSDQFPETMENLKKMGRRLAHAGESISETMEEGKITLKTINNQALPPAINFIDKLDRVASNIDALSKELKHNPSMIIRGKTPKRLGPGEH